jgi:hypothetical protein
MTKQDVVNYITTILTPPVNVVSKIVSSFQKVLDFITESNISDIVPAWTNALTFNADGSGAGKYCKYPDDNGNLRLFESLTAGNINHTPPSDPLVTSNTYWQEISPSSGSSIKEWAAGVFGSGLIIVYHNHSVHGEGLYLLTEPTRPFNSTAIETEVTAGKWVRIDRTSALSLISVISSLGGALRDTKIKPITSISNLTLKAASVNGAVRISRAGDGEQIPYLVLGSQLDSALQNFRITTQGLDGFSVEKIGIGAIVLAAQQVIVNDEQNTLSGSGYVAPTNDISINPISGLISSSKLDLKTKGAPGVAASNDGKNVTVEAGDAYGTSGNGNGGNVIIKGGAKRAAGTGHNGYVLLQNIPTSSAGLPSGAIWNNAGVLSIV